MLEFRIPKHVVFLVNEVALFYGDEISSNLHNTIKNFEKILQCVDWCLRFNIREVTISVFSCVTFKFSQQEIDKVVLAFRIILLKWLNSEVLDSKGIRLNVIDQSSFLPAHISNLIRIIENLTKNNKHISLNIIVGHVGEAQLNTLASNFQLITDQPAPEQDVFSNCILSSVNEPQLIISNCAHKRLTDYLFWKPYYTINFTLPIEHYQQNENFDNKSSYSNLFP